MAFIGPFIPYIAAGVAAMGAMSASKAQEDNAAAQRDALNYDKAVAENNATNALQVASINEDRTRRQSAGQLGSQRAALAESGIDLTSGTGADLTHDSAVNAEMDALNVRYSGVTQAVAYRNNAKSLGNAAQVADNNRRSAQMNGPLAAGAAALSAYGSYKGAGLSPK